MNTISLNELREMTDREGLILQGCGGDPQEWIDGINEMLTEQGILLDGDKFKNVSSFEHEGYTNLLFHMDDVKLNVGKLAMWRLASHNQFGGTWLSDFLVNRMGVDLTQQESPEKPECPLIGADSNVFNLIGLAARTLRENDMADAASEMTTRVTESGSYDEALGIIMEYVTPVSTDEYQSEDFDMRM